MTCKEAAELIYAFAETKPSTRAQKEFQDHVRKCRPCVQFIRKLGKQTQAGFDVGCGEIPDTLLEEFSQLMRSNLGGMEAT
ncbi:MAG: zf-HC2 domain-containing protein [Candidatus Omnitrophica bacterium]|nr:zf-HC2 domain-containing protein [Candidatus Omnitrophota bacterium]